MKLQPMLALAAAIVLTTGIGQAAKEVPVDRERGRKLSIVATVFPLAEFARDIAGARGEVTLLLPPGADVHTWMPRVSDIRKLENADLLLSVGRMSFSTFAAG